MSMNEMFDLDIQISNVTVNPETEDTMDPCDYPSKCRCVTNTMVCPVG